jgi:ATP-dependent Clp protease ATP-binding subunit ClpA
MFSQDAQQAIHVAFEDARERQHELVSVEHLLYGLLLSESIHRLLSYAGVEVELIKEELLAFLDQRVNSTTRASLASSPPPSEGLRRVILRAVTQMQEEEHHEITSAALLLALFGYAESFAANLLARSGLTQIDIVLALSMVGGENAPRWTWLAAPPPEDDDDPFDLDEEDSYPYEDIPFDDDDDIEHHPSHASNPKPRHRALGLYTTNLNELAKDGKLDPVIGREAEIERAVHVLSRRRKNHPLFVGEAGVGKTAIAEGLVSRIVEGKIPPSLRDAVVYRLNLGTLIAGTRYRGDFEERLNELLDELATQPDAILFIDEMHMLVGAGTGTDAPNDASNLLKPLLTNGSLRCMGSTSFKEYRRFIERDRAFARRFQRIDIEEPSQEISLAILEGIKKKYEDFHEVTYPKETLAQAISLCVRYLPDRHLPDKAVDVIDEAGAWVKLKRPKKRVVDVSVIQQIVARMAKLPPQEVGQDDRLRLRDLEAGLRNTVFGQDEAIRQLVAAIKLSRSGLGEIEKPLGSFLLTGPTGVGKTEVAIQLARGLGIPLLRFDMSEYMERHSASRLIGSPPGYIGFEQGGLLTDAVHQSPYAVLLLDEIEKAHPDILNLLLQIMDYGKLTDQQGRTTDFRHVVLLMTSNVGARESSSPAIGFGMQSQPASDEKALRSVFSPEFRNRLDARIRFAPLTPAIMELIVGKFIEKLRQQLTAQGASLQITPPALQRLAQLGFDPLLGARPLARVIREKIKLPLSDALLFGALKQGGRVRIDLKENNFSFDFTQETRPKSKSPAKRPSTISS